MRVATLLFCISAIFAQSSVPSSDREPAKAPDKKDCPSSSGIVVCINAPANLEVEAGGSRRITATVTGTKEQAVDWIVDCPSSQCGRMTNDLYTAPIVRPNPPEVTLTAVSKADPTVKALVIVRLVKRASTYVPGVVTPPRLLNAPEPEYTEQARESNAQGTCALELIVEEDGLPSHIRVVKSIGTGLDEKAIAAVQKWKFEPALKDGHPVKVRITVEVQFHLDQESEHPK